MLLLGASPTDTYLSFFLTRPVWDVWSFVLLGLARLIPIIGLAPFLGGRVLSDPMKIGFAIALLPIFLPQLILQSSGNALHIDAIFVVLLVKEVFIGSLLGFLITIPFYFSQAAGTLIDHQRGAQSLQVSDPSTQVQSSPIGMLYNNVMLIAFFAIGGHLLFFDAILTSYKVIPADQFLNASFFAKQAPHWAVFMKLINMMLTITLQLSAPSLIAILMSDLFLGIANRMAPEVQISFLLWSLKAYVAIAILWAGWWFILKQMDIQALNWIKLVNTFAENLGYTGT
jgi:type III secretion protein T